MECKIIHQFGEKGKTDVISVLEKSANALLEAGNLQSDHFFFRVVTGHASERGIKLVRERIIARLLSAQNFTVQWVVGVDFNNRSGETFRALRELVCELGGRLGKRLGIFIFSSNGRKNGNGQHGIMHTKFYWMGWLQDGQTGGLDVRRATQQVHYTFVGSSNLSMGGLRENLEMGVLSRLTEKDKGEIRRFEKLWKAYRHSDRSMPLDGERFFEKFYRKRQQGDWNRGRHRIRLEKRRQRQVVRA